MLDIAKISPAMVQLFLIINIGHEYSSWFCNKQTEISQNKEFLDKDVFPDLNEYVEFLHYIFTSPVVCGNLTAECVTEYVHQIFKPAFFSLLLVYPYNQVVIKLLISEYCRDNHERSNEMWEMLINKAHSSLPAERPYLLNDNVIFFCCGINDGLVKERIAMVLGLDGAPVNSSIQSLWSRPSDKSVRVLPNALLFANLCKIPFIRPVILANIRKFKWLEFAFRERAAKDAGADFARKYHLKDEDVETEMRAPDNYFMRSNAPAAVCAYAVMRSTIHSLEESLEEPMPNLDQPNSEMQVLVEELRMYEWHEPENDRHDEMNGGIPAVSAAAGAGTPLAVVAVPSDTNPSTIASTVVRDNGSVAITQDLINQVKEVAADTFTDEQIRVALKRNNGNAEAALNDLFTLGY